jgi:hypothetical protein
MKKKKYEVTEEGERDPEEFMCYRIPHTRCERQKNIIIIIIIIINPPPFRNDPTAVLGSHLFSTWPLDLLVLS